MISDSKKYKNTNDFRLVCCSDVIPMLDRFPSCFFYHSLLILRPSDILHTILVSKKFIFYFFIFWDESKMFRNIDLEQSKDHNSKNVSSVARVLQGSFGIKLLAPVVFGKFLLLDPPFHPTKRPVKSEITMTLLKGTLWCSKFGGGGPPSNFATP